MTTLLDVQGRRVVGYLTNKSGGSVAKGDVVIVDSSNDEAFKTSTAGAEVVGVGVVAEENGIANNATGRVVFSGYVDLINVSASVTRGDFGKTHTVAKQSVSAGTTRAVGVFCQYLKSGTTPSAMVFGQPDGSTGAGGLSGGTPALTLGTTNAAGAASTGIRTDATIAAFDATVPVTQAFGDSAAAGSAGVAARRDHKHGMPANPGTVPGWLAWFIGTSDASNYFWTGSDLAGFTAHTVSGSATWLESHNLIDCLFSNQTANDAAVQLIAKSFSTGDTWTLAINAMVLGSDVGNSTAALRGVGIIFADGTSDSSNCVIGHLQLDNGAGSPAGQAILVGRHGTLTDYNTGAPWVSQTQYNMIGNWLFISLKYQAANTFRLSFGPTADQLSSFGEADISKTMTPSYVGLFVSEANAGTALASFGPLRKTA